MTTAGSKTSDAAKLQRAADWPLSFVQQRIWLMQRLQPGTRAFQRTWLVSLRGELDGGRLQRALAAVLRRHPVLARTCDYAPAGPVLRATDGLPLPVPIVDLGGLGAGQRVHVLEDLCRQEARRGLEPEAGALWRGVLVRANESLHQLVLTLHRMAADDPSVRLLLQDLARFYQGTGGGPTPASVETTYGAYAREQLEHGSSERLMAAADTWRQRLEGAESRPSLRWSVDDDPSSPELSVTERVPGELQARLAALAERWEIDLGDLVFTAWARVLGELFETSDLVVGLVVDGRRFGAGDGTLGNFSHLLPVRCRWDGKSDLRTLAEEIAAGQRVETDLERLPYEALAELLAPELSLDPRPLLPLRFRREESGPRTVRTDSLELKLEAPVLPPAEADLELTVQSRGADLRLVLSYRQSVLSPEGAARAVREVLEVLQGTASASGAVVAGAMPEVSPAVHQEEPLKAADGERQRQPRPLSFSQQRLWFLQRIEPTSAAYNMALPKAVYEALVPEAFSRACRQLMERQQVLRTLFVEVDGEPRQVVQRTPREALPVVDLGRLGSAAEAEAAKLVQRDAARPFDLARDLPLRIHLLRHGDARWTVTFTLHHIAGDDWSMEVLARELMTFYDAATKGVSGELPPLPVQYADFAEWQRRRLSGERLDRELEFWRQQLGDLPAELELPWDRPRQPQASPAAGMVTADLPAELIRRLQELSRRQRATLFHALFAAFQLLLARLSGQRHFCVGAPVANRQRPEVENLVGFFVNTLVLRSDLADGPGFAELIRRAGARSIAAQAHQDLPFEKLVAELAPERSLDRSPLFQVMLSLQYRRGDVAAPPTSEGSEGSEGSVPAGDSAPQPTGGARPMTLEAGSAKFDLALQLTELPFRVQVQLEYRRSLVDPTTAERWVRYLSRLLRRALDAPQTDVWRLPLLSSAERHQVAWEWSGEAPPWHGGEPLRRDGLVHRFLAWARRSPEAPAVLAADGAVLTYGELERWSRALALELRVVGLAAEEPVALLVERSPAAVAGILAILRAGGAYLPLDPEQPAVRRAFMAEDAGARLGLVAPELMGSAGEETGALHWLPLRALDAWPEGLPVADLDGGPESGDALAYTMYTSGSTGRPKGIDIPRRAVARLVLDTGYLRFGPDERLAFASNLSFDASTLEIWGALLHGASLAVVPREAVLDAEGLGAHLEARGVTTVFMTTALLHQVATLAPASLAGVRQVAFGGETADPRRVRALLDAGPPQRLLHVYGPTENTTFSTWSKIQEIGARATTVPIGRALDHSSVLVLDRWGAPSPLGGPGELCVGGVGLARGYRRRPSLTAESFVPHPMAGRGLVLPGARLYRTGDRARWLAGGEIDFQGRADRQVKIRGFRIEPGEVESVLVACPAAASSVVEVVEAGSRGRRLVAYWVAAKDEGDEEALRRWAQEQLPAYMVPSAWVKLDELPLTANGKVDRRALPAPDSSAEAALVAPRTPLEESVAAVWREVLGVEAVGAEDDFFALGGHSLLAIQVVSRLRSRLGVELPLRTVFEAPTVAGQAAVVAELESGLESGGGSLPGSLAGGAPPLGPVPRDRPLPLSFAQQRLWFLDQLDPGSTAYNMPFGLRLRGPLSVQNLRASLSEVARRHEVLRTVFESGSFESGAEEPVQRVLPPAPVALPVVDLSGLSRRPVSASDSIAEDAVLALASAEGARPFDLRRGPVLRTRLLRLAPEHHVLLLTLHHIAGDGWSLEVLTKEMTELYASGLYADARAGRRSSLPVLPELPVQYGDYAVWQRSWLRGAVLEAELEHWRRRLADAPPLLEVPTDHPRRPLPERRARSVELSLGESAGARLEQLARQLEATPFTVLLAAWMGFLARLSGQRRVSVGTPVAGRSRLELEPLVGFFVNTLVISVEAPPEGSFRQLVTEVQEAMLEAQEHAEVPFERLVEELAPERSLSHTPLFQAFCAFYQGRGGDGAESSRESPEDTSRGLGDLSLEPLMDTSAAPAKFDLSLYLSGGAGADDAGAMDAALEVTAELFDATTAGRWGEQLERLMKAALHRPGTPLAELPLLSPAQSQQLTVEWPWAPAAPGDWASAVEPFLEQARRRPEAPALRWGDTIIRYRTLQERSRALALQLRRLGVGPEVPVAVCLRRTPRLPMALLAVWLAGGAYVPLDPEYPEARLRFMLDDSQAALVLTESAVEDRLPEASRFGNGRGRRFLLDRELDWLVADPQDSDALPLPLPRQLAYLIYTSGSTGRPKGVAIEHGSAAALLAWAVETFSRDELAVTLAATSVCFDLSIFELFAPLAAGGSVLLVDDALALGQLSPEAAPTLINPTLINTVPSVLGEVLAQVSGTGGGLPASVRTINLAGEALPTDLVARLRGEPGVRRVLNLYGPSEDTTYSTAAEVLAESGPPPIGRSVTGKRSRVLADGGAGIGAGVEIPMGVAGELYLGGAGLARGYWRRAALTAQRFLPDPGAGCTTAAGARLYRTGDRVRWRRDGALEYLGRLDRQIKLRGFRIEVGEVEAALRAHPQVADAAVAAVDAGADRFLGAWFTEDSGAVPVQESLSEELRRWLAERLPSHLVPQRLWPVAALPLTASGKLDRGALRPPEEDLQRTGSGGPPRGELEETLAELWREVLGWREAADVSGEGVLGRHDDFFTLGGHSLLAVRLIGRIGRELGVDLSLRAVFEAPTVASLAVRIREAGTESTAPPIVPVPRDRPLPLSFAQQRLWFLDRLEGGSTYNMPLPMPLDGDLVPEALHRALDGLVRRHEVLRTRFVVMDGEPRQVVEPSSSRFGHSSALPLPVVDLRRLAGAGEAAARQLAAAEAERPFDLAADAPFRACLVRLGAEAGGRPWLALFNLHHIAGDAWSLEILERDLRELYTAALQQRRPQLPALPVQYGDYAVWQRNLLRGERLQAELDFWRRELAEVPPVLDLPRDRSFSGMPSPQAAVVSHRLGPQVLRGLNAAARRHHGTLFGALVASIHLWLARLSGQSVVAVGAPVANRQRGEVADLLGFFVNTLVLRSDLADGPGFDELVRRTQRRLLEAQSHQELPFERLVEELAPDRSLEHTPLFQVSLTFHPLAASTAEPGADSEAEAAAAAAKFDLMVEVRELVDGLRVDLQYRKALWQGETLRRWSRSLETLLTGALAEPETDVWNLPLLTPEEERRMLFETSGEASPWPEFGAGPVTRFLAWARRTPAAPVLVSEAVISEGGDTLTYAELEAWSGALAQRLQDLGVAPEEPVALLAEGSAAAVAGILGILRAGGAYLPLDPSYPPRRLAAMVEDAGATKILVAEELEEAALPWLASSRLAVLSLASRPPADAGEGFEDAPENPAALAYVMYTSGSTGRPKGVEIERRAVTRLVLETDSLHFGPEQRWSLLSNLSFDASTLELWGALLHGGSLAVIPRSAVLDVEGLGDHLLDRGVTSTFLTTALLHQVAQLAPGSLAGLQQVTFGGEAADLRRLRAMLAAGAPERLVNGYGPTENTTYSTVFSVHDLATDAVTVPIGRPIAHSSAWVLDARGAAVPTGVVGELFVGGAGLARSYRQRPALTAESFVPHPRAGAGPVPAGARLYRTGDRARWTVAGELEFFGRRDQQVKIRGHRIEPLETESVLAACPQVAAAAVVARVVGGAGPELVAYWVPVDEESADESEPQRWLEDRLPAYMLPSLWVQLERLPLTANGKVDRRALPAPRRPGSTGRAPRGRLEEALAEIWGELLKLDRVGAEEDFFALGGHSLLAAQVAAQVRDRLGMELSLQAFFEIPTVAALARRLAGEDEATGGSLVALTPEAHGDAPPVFWIHAATGLAQAYRPLVRALVRALGQDGPDSVPHWGVQARGLDGGEEPRRSLPEMAAAYLEEIRRVQPAGPYRLVGWSLGGVVAFEMARQLRAAGETVEPLVLLDAVLGAVSREDLANEALLVGSFAAHLGLPAPKPWAGNPLEALLQDAEEGGLFPRRTLEHLFAVYRASLEGLASYDPGPLDGSQDGTVHLLQAAQPVDEPAERSWRRLPGLDLRVQEVPGDHFGLLAEDNLPVLVERLRRLLGD